MKSKKQVLAIAFLALIFAPIVAWFASKEPCVDVRLCETEKALVRIAAKPETEITLWFFHSYDRAFFEEHYLLKEDGSIVLTHMVFKSCLNGQGFEMGSYRSRLDGSAELVGINKNVSRIFFRLGSPDMANHTLFIGERRFRLLDYAEAGDMICISSGFCCRWEEMRNHFPFIRRHGSFQVNNSGN
jgi:hypothetical protein